jgi:hypothetical protein
LILLEKVEKETTLFKGSIVVKNITKKSSGQFKASHFLRSKKARPFKLRADLGVMSKKFHHKQEK